MVRPRTYSTEPKKKSKSNPWRLLRHVSDLHTCFVGVSFYRSVEGDKPLTSVAQVFNERGQGVIVKAARRSSPKTTQHLTYLMAMAML